MWAPASSPNSHGRDQELPESAVVTTATPNGTSFEADRPASPPATVWPGSTSTAKWPALNESAAMKMSDPSGRWSATTWRDQFAPASVEVSKIAHGQVRPGAALAMYPAAITPLAAAMLPPPDSGYAPHVTLSLGLGAGSGSQSSASTGPHVCAWSWDTATYRSGCAVVEMYTSPFDWSTEIHGRSNGLTPNPPRDGCMPRWTM